MRPLACGRPVLAILAACLFSIKVRFGWWPSAPIARPSSREASTGPLASGKPRQASPSEAPLPHGGDVFTVAFSPDGKTILTASRESAARLWEVRTGQTPSYHYDPFAKCRESGLQPQR